MADFLVLVWNMIRIVLLCISGFFFVLFSYIALSLPAVAIANKREEEEKGKEEPIDFFGWALTFFIQVSLSVLSFSVWRALYYKTWVPVILLLIAFIPWEIVSSIVIGIYERRAKE